MVLRNSLAKCNNSECDKKNQCARYDLKYKSEYDFKAISKFWDCFVEKNDEGENNDSN
jgi:hypothetical protein